MTKAKLKFNLNNPEDVEHYNRCNKSLDMASALFDIVVNLRKTADRKLESEYEKGGYPDEAEVIYEEINEILDKYNINIDELIS